MIRIRLQDMFVRWVETTITSKLSPPCEIFAQAHDKWDELLSLHGDQLVERLHRFLLADLQYEYIYEYLC